LVSLLAGALVAKLHTRSTKTCANVPCDYLHIRLAAIDQMIVARSREPTYLVIGDSLTEIAPWRPMCGYDPVAAGISGARSDTWLPYAKVRADALKPHFIVLALGTNDILTQGRLGPYEQLASTLSAYRLIAVPVHKMPGAPHEVVRKANGRIAKTAQRTAEPIEAATTDGVHLTTADYALWFGAIEKTACSSR
jgi:lysophospholipase L1-like esterase